MKALQVCPCCTGLDECSELRQLHITDCGMTNELGLVACQALRQVTELRLQEQMADEPIISFVADAMPQLVILDISYGRLGCATTYVAAGGSALWPPPVAALDMGDRSNCVQ